MQTSIRIATRKSPLALWQAEAVKARLLHFYPFLEVTLLPLSTQGDEKLDHVLSSLGGKGIFVKELEQALLNHEADIAVHSMKDVPMCLPETLQLTAMLPRGSVEDAFVSEAFPSLASLFPGARVGTSSPRRQAILQEKFPHLVCVNVRGNVQTRLSKHENQEFDALILAVAGLERLALSHKIKERLSTEIFLPAPGQGAIGIESRCDDSHVNRLLRSIGDANTWDTVIAERAVSQTLNAGCGTPLAAYAVLEQEQLFLRAWKVSDSARVTASLRGHRRDASVLGKKVAEKLLESQSC